jgi:hypothetical protein
MSSSIIYKSIDINIKNNLKSYFKPPFDIKEIIDYIDKIDTILEYNYLNIKLIIYYRKNIDIFDINFIKRIIIRATKINNTKKFVISLILSPAKKTINYKLPLSCSNVNSGFTFINSNNIFIFRKEEFAKVIIHEILHHNLTIHSEIFKNENKNRLLTHFNLHPNTKLILNEAIIEFWATIIHLYFISNEYNLNYNKLLNIELKYSLFKSYQVFLYQKKNSINNLWFDDTTIYSYIIFKTIFLYYFIEFKKIYTFPYNDTIITDFIIKHSKIKKNKINPSFTINKKIIQRDSNSLCFMLLSDL